MSTWRRLALATVVCGGVVLGAGGCAKTNEKASVEPSWEPSERSTQPDAQTVDPTEQTSAADADLAAKQAAAQEVMRKVKDRDPEEEKKKMERSRAISAQAAKELQKGMRSEAVRTARQALKVHEQNVDAMLVIAKVYYQEGKYELVRAVTTSALAVDPKIRTPEDTSRAYNLQGFAMIAMGDDGLATQSFKKAAEVDENNAVAWNNLGTRYLDAGDVQTATACFQYALELDPRFHRAHLNYGAALRAQQKWEEAEAEMRKALELHPNYPEAYFNLGVLYLDADPFPGLETKQRLNKAILNLTKYRELAIADGGRPGARGPGIGTPGGATAPARVGKERADDYIRVAKKAIEREEHREEKAAKRAERAAEEAAEAEKAAAEAAKSGEPPAGDPAGDPVDGAGATEDGGESGDDPGAPAPTQPVTPTTPAPQGPATPAPQGPTQPAPQGPAKPAPTKPAPQGPTAPAPSKPAPTPAPTPPPPAAPAPQKPSVQKPQSASLRSWQPATITVKKVPTNPASRGTRLSPSTLSPMEVGAFATSRVALTSGPRSTDAMPCAGSASATPMVIDRTQPSTAASPVPPSLPARDAREPTPTGARVPVVRSPA